MKLILSLILTLVFLPSQNTFAQKSCIAVTSTKEHNKKVIKQLKKILSKRFTGKKISKLYLAQQMIISKVSGHPFYGKTDKEISRITYEQNQIREKLLAQNKEAFSRYSDQVDELKVKLRANKINQETYVQEEAALFATFKSETVDSFDIPDWQDNASSFSFDVFASDIWNIAVFKVEGGHDSSAEVLIWADKKKYRRSRSITLSDDELLNFLTDSETVAGNEITSSGSSSLGSMLRGSSSSGVTTEITLTNTGVRTTERRFYNGIGSDRPPRHIEFEF